MFRKFARKWLANPLDRKLKRLAKKGGRKILLGWNRGLGDIPLGLYAIVLRIKELVPQAEITFVTRSNLADGFSMLEGVQVVIDPQWERGKKAKIDPLFKKEFDLILEEPSPTDWVYWQHGKVVPKLKWDSKHDSLYKNFSFLTSSQEKKESDLYIGVQVSAETNYGLWRNWPLQRWEELFSALEKMGVRVLLFGFGKEPHFPHSNVIDLRGKTTLFELLSIIKHKLFALILPDSGISSMTYYLNASFPLKLITLWADPHHGILKQNVSSPNPLLVHTPLMAQHRDLSTLSADRVLDELCAVKKTAPLILAGGQGTRLAMTGPKGMFSIEGKTLFQWICEKIPKGQLVAIMTSALNHEETVSYFEKNSFFGLEIHFFQQEMGVILDEEKRPTEEKSPNGNGSVFRSFEKSGLLNLFAERGIDLVTITYIDNPLANPLDQGLIFFARLKNAEVVLQCIEKSPEDPPMGVLVEQEGKVQVIEYLDCDPKQSYRYAYSGQLAFSFSFFSKMAQVELPLHWVQKTLQGKTIWKGEKFIFDVLAFADRVFPYCVQKKTHYAPIKGIDSIEKAKTLLLEANR